MRNVQRRALSATSLLLLFATVANIIISKRNCILEPQRTFHNDVLLESILKYKHCSSVYPSIQSVNNYYREMTIFEVISLLGVVQKLSATP